MMWIIPSLLSVIYWLWPACFHLYKGNSTRRFMYAKYLAFRAPFKTLRSFWKEASPRQAVPSSQWSRLQEIYLQSPPSCRHCQRLCTCTRELAEEEDGDRQGLLSPHAPLPGSPHASAALCSNCLLAPALAFCSTPLIARALTGTQFSFGSNKKWKLKAMQAADKALLKTGWDHARDGVQGRGRSQDDCKLMGISQYWIIKKNKIFSICFFTPYVIEAIKYIQVRTNRLYFNLDINIYFQQRTSLLQQEDNGARRLWL